MHISCRYIVKVSHLLFVSGTNLFPHIYRQVTLQATHTGIWGYGSLRWFRSFLFMYLSDATHPAFTLQNWTEAASSKPAQIYNLFTQRFQHCCWQKSFLTVLDFSQAFNQRGTRLSRLPSHIHHPVPTLPRRHSAWG